MESMPFDIQIKNPASGRSITVRCTALLRELLGKRRTCDGLWENRPVIVKVFTSRLRGPFHRRREIKGFSLLRQRGIPASQVLFEGRDAAGSFVVVFEKITPAVNLAELFAEDTSEAIISEIGPKWVDLLAAMHQKGILQKDLHQGNFLWNGQTLFALDVGMMRFRRHPIPIRTGLRQLAQLISTLPETYQADPKPLLDRYCQKRNCPAGEKQLARLQRLIEKARLQSLRRTLKKTLRTSKRYFALREGPMQGMFTRKDWTEETARQFVRQIDRLMESGQILKRGNTCFVSRVRFGTLDIAVKRYNHKGWLHSLRHTLKGSRARRCWLTAHRLQQMNIPSARPLAFIEQRTRGILRQSYFLSAFVEGASLDKFLKSPASFEEKQKLLEQMETLFSRLTQNRITYGDPKPSNFLLTPQNQPLMIDLDSIRIHRCKPLLQIQKNRMEKRFVQKINNVRNALHLKSGCRTASQ